MATAACVLLVITLFDSMATVRSADMREQIADRLSRAPADGLGLDVAGVVDLLRGVVLFSGALAAAGAVLAVFALQRHRGARIGLTVIAVLMLFSATFVSGLLPILVAVAASMMWGREARDWFAGRTPAPPRSGSPTEPRPDRAAVWPTVTPPPPRATISGDDRPGPAGQPFGVAPAATARRASSTARRRTPRPARPPSRPGGGDRGGVADLGVLRPRRDGLLADGAGDPGRPRCRWSRRSSATARSPTAASAAARSSASSGSPSPSRSSGALGAIALAVLAFRRVEVGRVALVVSASLAALVCLLAVPVGWPHAVAAFTCVALLNRPSTQDWFAGRDRPTGTAASRRRRQRGRRRSRPSGLRRGGQACRSAARSRRTPSSTHRGLLAERPAHHVPALVLVVVEHLRRDRHDAGPLGQREAERHRRPA